MRKSISITSHVRAVEPSFLSLKQFTIRSPAAFGKWVTTKFGVSAELIFPAAHTNVSVVEDGSEADVVATFRTTSNLNHGLFVENKIDGILMPKQLERYVRR